MNSSGCVFLGILEKVFKRHMLILSSGLRVLSRRAAPEWIEIIVVVVFCALRPQSYVGLGPKGDFIDIKS